MAGDSHDVLVIGAGLAGLTAARILHRFGYGVVVLEQQDEVGGRIRTDLVDGFQLDHGFQLFNPAYPAGPRTFDYPDLDLQPFDPGVEVLRNGSWSRLLDPRRQPRTAGSTLWQAIRGSVAAPWELAPFAAYVGACATESVSRLRQRPDVTIAQALRRWGVGRAAIDRLVGPFLAGVFADLELATSRRYADLVLRSFGRGAPSLPAGGMQALPQQIAAGLPAGIVRLGVAVRTLRGTTASTDRGTVTGRLVIVATQAPAAARLLPGLAVVPMSALTTWYFAADTKPPRGDGLLVLDGTGSPMLSNVAVLTAAAPSYSADGRALVAASAVGHYPDAEVAAAARVDCARLLGVGPAQLSEIGRYAIVDALPSFVVGTPLRRSPAVSDDVLVVGDHRATPSIQGALVSGEQGALAAIRRLGFTGP